MGSKKKKCETVIAKVRKSRTSGQKTITIPKSAKSIREGDYIQVKRIKR